MLIFISWSGSHSKEIAKALRDWLPSLIQSASIWMSDQDIEAGDRWRSLLDLKLQESAFGIVCLTPDNLQAAWLHFEAGAIAKMIEKSRVCPYLFEVTTTQITGPLLEFQSKAADREGTLDLLKSINASLEKPLQDSNLVKIFDKWWPDLEDQLAKIKATKPAQPPTRNEREMIEEILSIVRERHELPAGRTTTWGPPPSPEGVSAKLHSVNESLAKIEEGLDKLIARQRPKDAS